MFVTLRNAIRTSLTMHVYMCKCAAGQYSLRSAGGIHAANVVLTVYRSSSWLLFITQSFDSKNEYGFCGEYMNILT